MDQDVEIAAMDAVARALAPLDDGARRRVIGWVASRYGFDTPRAIRPAATSDPSRLGPPDDASTGFETFAELFDRASPGTEKEKALVAAYWVQVCQTQPTFAAQSLTTCLKDLGHGVSNITASLDQLKEEKPALVLQLRKSGTTKQARKTYKLTQEGARRVRGMIERSD